MKKFKVRFTRTETYVHEETVEAKGKAEAILKVECGDWSWPDKPDAVEGNSEAEEV